MHLEIVVNHNSNCIRVDEIRGKRGETIACNYPANTVRILNEIFDKLVEHNLMDATDITKSIVITEINEDSVKQTGEW